MNKKGSYMLGILIIAFGVLLLLGQLGINIGWIIGLIIPIYFVYKGWKLFVGTNNSTFKKGFGITLMIVGALWLTAMLPVIIGLLLAGFLIYYGIKMIKKHQAYVVAPEMAAMRENVNAKTFTSDSLHSTYDELDEWEKQLKK